MSWLFIYQKYNMTNLAPNTSIAQSLGISGTLLTRLSPGSGGARTAGAKFGSQEFIRSPAKLAH